MIKSYTYTSLSTGPKLLIFGGIHGNEICGPVAMKKIMAELESGQLILKSGSVTFVPECNPKAAMLDKRFVDENLNRVFCSTDRPVTYEQHLANVLTPFVNEADYVLDIHSFHTPGSSIVFQDYVGQARNEFAKIQGVSYLILGFPEVYADAAVQAVSTESYAFEQGKVAITVEAGCHKDPLSIPRAKQAILNSMAYLGLIEGDPIVTDKMKQIRLTEVVMKRKEGRFVQDFENIHKMNAGETVVQYADGGTFLMPVDGYIFMPNPEALMNQEWFYLGKEVS